MSEATQADNPYSDREASLSDYFEIIGRRKWWALTALVVGSVISVGVAMILPPVYQSSGTILINDKTAGDQVITAGADEGVQVEQTIELLTRSIMTKGNLIKIANEHDLFPDQRAEWPEQILVKAIEDRVNFSMLGTEVGNLGGKRNKNPKQQVLELSFEYEKKPEVTQAVARSLIDLFIAKNAEDEQEINDQARSFLVKEEKKTRDRLGELEKAITKFKEENYGLLPKQMNFVVSERERTERELLSVEQQIRAIRASNIQLGGQMAGTEAYIYEDRTQIRNKEGERVLSATGRLQTLQQQYHELISKYSPQHPKVKKIVREIESLGGNVSQLSASPLTNDNLELAEVELAEARQKYSSSHPTVQRLEDRVERLRREAVSSGAAPERKDFNTLRRINPAFSALKAGISSGEAELQSLYERRDKLLAKIDSYTDKMSFAPSVEERIKKLDREYQSVLQQNSEINDRLVNIERQKAFEEGSAADTFVLLEEPELPIAPIKPNRKAIVALGILLSLGFAFALAMLLESLDESVTGQRALRRLTGKAPLGVIPVISG